MLDRIWEKLSNICGILAIGSLFGLIAFMTNVEIKDLDLWLHLAMGKFISLHHYVPDTDMLSATIAGNHWVNHEWLFQVIVYQITEIWGFGGLQTMQMVVICSTMFVLLFLGYQKDKQLVVALGLMMVFMVYQQRFTMRPDIFSLFFFSIYMFILSLHIDKRWSLFVLGFVQIVWSNMHGFFFLGPVLILLGIISEWIKRNVTLPYEWNDIGRLTDEEFGRMKIAFVIVCLACFANPLFIDGALYPLRVLFTMGGENQIFFDNIQELQKPITSNNILMPRGMHSYYQLMIFISFITFIFNRRKIDVSALLLWLLFLIFSLQAARNTIYFAFAAYLVAITNIMSTDFKNIIPINFSDKKFAHITSSIAKVMLIIWLATYAQTVAGWGYYDFDKYERKSEFGGISLKNYADKAVDFLVENQIKGNFFNDFNSGSYLLGRTFPDIKVFIDGRTEVYGAEFFKEYQKIYKNGDSKLFNELADKFNLTGVLLNSSKQRVPNKLFKYLYNSEDWILVYLNYDGVILLRDVPEHKKVIDEHRINLEEWQAEKADLYAFGSDNVLPYQYYYRAYTLEAVGMDDAALSEAIEGIRIAPDYVESYKILGKVYAKRKEFEKAFENFRIVSLITPHNKENRYNLALAYTDLKKYDEALGQYLDIVNMWPGESVKVSFLMARLYALDAKKSETMLALKKAYNANPNAVRDVVSIGDMYYDRDDYQTAMQIYLMVLDARNRKDLVHFKIGKTFLKMDQLDKARKEFTKALDINPENKDVKEALMGMDGLTNSAI